jgi:hypothetical protein
LPRRCRTVDAISQSRPSSTANSIAVLPCRVSCWLEVVPRNVLRAFPPTFPSPCPGE